MKTGSKAYFIVFRRLHNGFDVFRRMHRGVQIESLDSEGWLAVFKKVASSVSDPDPDPHGPHLFRSAGSGSS